MASAGSRPGLLIFLIMRAKNKLAALVATFGWAFCFLPLAAGAETAAAKPLDLATTDWSVNSAHNLASNPPPADSVQAFVYAVLGGGAVYGMNKVCDYRFADLRHSGNLSLIVSPDAGRGCNQTCILDKTPTGFQAYCTFAAADDLRDSIRDINHDGNLELVLWGPLAPSETQGRGCEWPLVFAWTGFGYSEVSSEYKNYYEHYLDSLRKKLAAASPTAEEAEAPNVGHTPASQPTIAGYGAAQGFSYGSSGGNAAGILVPIPAVSLSPAAAPVPTPEPEDPVCLRIEIAKTEQFLGIHSDATMIGAIKASESNDSNKRILAAVIFSYIGTSEAVEDLKELANDSDPQVAKIAKSRLSYGLDPGEYYRKVD